jgi:arginine exporter protein ArgO
VKLLCSSKITASLVWFFNVELAPVDMLKAFLARQNIWEKLDKK